MTRSRRWFAAVHDSVTGPIAFQETQSTSITDAFVEKYKPWESTHGRGDFLAR
jgi:hypothetical protein